MGVDVLACHLAPSSTARGFFERLWGDNDEALL